MKKMRMSVRLASCALFLASSALADIYVRAQPGLGNIVLTAVYSTLDGSLLGADVRGTTVALVGSPLPVGYNVITDGGSPGGFGNSLLLATDFPAFSELAVVSFNFTQSIITGTVLHVPGTGFAIGPVSSPLLLPLIGTLDYRFDMTSFTTSTGFAVAQFTFDDAATTVPEPDSRLLAVTGCLFLFGIKRLTVRRRISV